MKYLLALALITGCVDNSDLQTSASDEALTSTNGLSLNGMSLNGMSLNGLSLNGLSLNGLSTTAFSSWFDADPATRAMTMSYIVKCAKATGTSLTWTDPASAVTYTWAGELDLARGWSNGSAMTVTEQQVLSACLGAHANKYGVHVPIAVEGRTATGVEIPRAANELTSYPVREAAWFGNLMNGDGVFVCLDHVPWLAAYSSPRACALDMATPGQTSPVCPPIVFAGACSTICTADASKTYYTSCKWNNKTYQPLATRFQSASVYSCGDGVCEISESCGTGTTASSCYADCGACAGTSFNTSAATSVR
ncbi:MAG TPA: hypothetical protein VIV58_11945 [Kofleriaceae bacterium]